MYWYVLHSLHIVLGVIQAIEQLSKYKVGSASGGNVDEDRYLRSLHPLSSLADLTLPLLQNIEKQLKTDLQIVREVCYFFGHLFRVVK